MDSVNARKGVGPVGKKKKKKQKRNKNSAKIPSKHDIHNRIKKHLCVFASQPRVEVKLANWRATKGQKPASRFSLLPRGPRAACWSGSCVSYCRVIVLWFTGSLYFHSELRWLPPPTPLRPRLRVQTAGRHSVFIAALCKKKRQGKDPASPRARNHCLFLWLSKKHGNIMQIPHTRAGRPSRSRRGGRGAALHGRSS